MLCHLYLFLTRSSLQEWTKNLLVKLGLVDNFSDVLAVIINIVALYSLWWISFMIIRTILRAVVRPWATFPRWGEGAVSG